MRTSNRGRWYLVALCAAALGFLSCTARAQQMPGAPIPQTYPVDVCHEPSPLACAHWHKAPAKKPAPKPHPGQGVPS